MKSITLTDYVSDLSPTLRNEILSIVKGIYRNRKMKMPKNPVLTPFNYRVNGKDTGDYFIFGVGVMPNKKRMQQSASSKWRLIRAEITVKSDNIADVVKQVSDTLQNLKFSPESLVDSLQIFNLEAS